jgi:hypothetical protein
MTHGEVVSVTAIASTLVGWIIGYWAGWNERKRQ